MWKERSKLKPKHTQSFFVMISRLFVGKWSSKVSSSKYCERRCGRRKLYNEELLWQICYFSFPVCDDANGAPIIGWFVSDTESFSYQSYLPFHPLQVCRPIRCFLNVSVPACWSVLDVRGFHRVERHRQNFHGLIHHSGHLDMIQSLR